MIQGVHFQSQLNIIVKSRIEGEKAREREREYLQKECKEMV
jgi:hypothetical protein